MIPAAEVRQIDIGAYHKYGAQATWVENIRFASKREAARFRELRLLERAGKIDSLMLQPKFPLIVNRVMVANYIADFYYRNKETGLWVVEDVKVEATKTAVYRLKAKLVKVLYNIEIQEVLE